MPARVLLGALPIAGCPSAARSTCTRPTRPRSFSHSLQIATDRLKGLERQHRAPRLRLTAILRDQDVPVSSSDDLASEEDLLIERLLDANNYLRAENSALRTKLGELQGCDPDVVEFDFDYDAELENLVEATTFNPAASPTTLPDPNAAPAQGSLEGKLSAGVRWPSQQEDAFWERPPRNEPLLVGGMQPPPTVKDSTPLHVVHLTAEMAPLAKVGGLGDVVTGLARASLDRGHWVEVMLPYYECLDQNEIEGLEFDCEFDCPKGYQWDGDFMQGSLKTVVYRARIDGIPVLLIRPDWSVCNIFKGGRIYGGSYNELEAYLYFSRAALECLRITERQPHIIHCHEWQTSAVPMLYWDVYASIGLYKPRVMLTIHNLDNTGECRQDEFAITGIPGEQFADVEKALDERTIGHNPERLSLMKGGIIYSNAITTVSPTYAQEALHAGAAGWLRSTLTLPDVKAKFYGFLNGIDTVMWDPSNDALLPATYSPAHMYGKQLCKRYLQLGLGLDVAPDRPLVACITRLVPQKGIHLIKHAIGRTAEQGGQFVLLGSGHADGPFKSMAGNEYANHSDVCLKVMYSEKLAHLIYAAADIVLVPSMFEPCGLTQLIALRYGAVPVVRKTGGLADTVRDVDDSSSGGAGNGFTFDGIDEGSLNGALDRAIRYCKERPEWWAKLSRTNMQVDCSWNRAADDYVALYLGMAQLE